MMKRLWQVFDQRERGFRITTRQGAKKRFFFEKKNQKTSAVWEIWQPECQCPQ
jgi:hypothetical protein